MKRKCGERSTSASASLRLSMHTAATKSSRRFRTGRIATISSDSLACVAIHGQTARPTLRRCKIHDGASGGLFVYDGGKGVLEECEISGNRLAGVEIREGASPLLRRCNVHDGAAA